MLRFCKIRIHNLYNDKHPYTTLNCNNRLKHVHTVYLIIDVQRQIKFKFNEYLNLLQKVRLLSMAVKDLYVFYISKKRKYFIYDAMHTS